MSGNKVGLQKTLLRTEAPGNSVLSDKRPSFCDRKISTLTQHSDAEGGGSIVHQFIKRPVGNFIKSCEISDLVPLPLEYSLFYPHQSLIFC